MQPGPRARIQELQTGVDQLLADGADDRQLAGALGELGQMYLAFDLFGSAEACFRRSAAAAPDDYRWSYYLAVSLQAQGHLEQALDAHLRVRDLRPRDTANAIRLGNLYLSMDQPEEARAIFDQVREREPESAAAHFGLGKAAARAGDHAAAIVHFERTLELQPGATVVHYPLGQSYRRSGDLDRARQQLQQRGDVDVTFSDPLGDEGRPPGPGKRLRCRPHARSRDRRLL